MELNETWLHGVGEGYEINTALSIVSISEFYEDGQELFAQGELADEIIRDIHSIWLAQNCTVEEAVNKYRLQHSC